MKPCPNCAYNGNFVLLGTFNETCPKCGYQDQGYQDASLLEIFIKTFIAMSIVSGIIVFIIWLSVGT